MRLKAGERGEVIGVWREVGGEGLEFREREKEVIGLRKGKKVEREPAGDSEGMLREAQCGRV